MATRKKASKKKTTSKKAVAKRSTQSVAAPSAAAKALMQSQTAGADADCFAIPFIRIVQSNSPQMKPQHAKFNEDAKPGMIVNTISNNLCDAVEILPVLFKREFLEWVPGDLGKLVGRHEAGSDIVNAASRDEKNKLITPEGNHLNDTREHFVLARMSGSERWVPALIAMARTQIKKSRDLMGQISDYKDNGHVMTFKLTSTPESNAEGDWYGWKIAACRNVNTDNELITQALGFAESITQGKVEIDVTEFSEGKAETQSDVDEDIPF